jgi:hypothetical protein
MMKSWRIVVWGAKARGVATMPHVVLCLVQTYVLPRALFGCQLWGPDMVAKGDGYTSPTQKILLRLNKYIFGVRRNVVSANLLHEVGPESLQHYWLKACMNFWSPAVHASKRNGLLRKVWLCELELGRVQQKSWLVACGALCMIPVVLVVFGMIACCWERKLLLATSVKPCSKWVGSRVH